MAGEVLGEVGVMLELRFSWQGQYLVMSGCHFSWQGQALQMGGCEMTSSMVESWSGHARIIVGSATHWNDRFIRFVS